MSGSAILTNTGLLKIASASPLDQLTITDIAVGDGVNPLSPTATGLVNEVYRDTASTPIRSNLYPDTLVFELNIPPTTGGFTVREIGAFDTDGDLIAVGTLDAVTKPTDGINLTVRINVKLQNAAQVDVFYDNQGAIDFEGLRNRNASALNNDDGLTAQNTHDATKAILIAQGLSGNYGFFEKGFTYSVVGDVGIDVDGKIYTYAGSDPLPVSVAAGTDPAGDSDYKTIELNIPAFKSITDVKAAKFLTALSENTSVKWQGYYEQSDGGSGSGILKFGAHVGDYGSKISIDSNTYIEVNLKGTINCMAFGIKGESDEYLRMQNMFNKVEIAKFNGATHYTSDTLYLPNNLIEIKGFNSTIHTDKEQVENITSSLLYSRDRNKRLKISDLTLYYTGTFDTGTSYGGKVSGIDINADQEFSGLEIYNVEAYGFNVAGIQIALVGEYIHNVKMKGCYLHHNRVAGTWFGYVDGITLGQGMVCEYNGAVTDNETGYGCAGISSCYPKNIVIKSGQYNYNYRKGIDTHSGYNVTIYNNDVFRNRYFGVFCIHRNDEVGTEPAKPSGYIIIKENNIKETGFGADLSFTNNVSAIDVGKYGTPETATCGKTLIKISDNIIDGFNSDIINFTSTPLALRLGAFYDVSVFVNGGAIKSSRSSYVFSIDGSITNDAGGRSKVSIENVDISAGKIDSSLVRLVKESNLKALSINNCDIEIEESTGSQLPLGLVNATSDVWGGAAPAGFSFKFDDNNVNIGDLTAFTQDIVRNYGLTYISAKGNFFNGEPRRDYINGTYRAKLTSIPTTETWLRGSVVENKLPVAGGYAGWRCTATGASGTWKGYGVIES